MKIIKNKINNSITIIPSASKDERGFFSRIICHKELKPFIKTLKFVQTNYSFSKKQGTLRGLHYQIKPFEEAKLVHCISGSIFDVVIDLRKNSSTYLSYESHFLSKRNKKLVYIPRGCAHGFLTMSNNTIIIYHVDNYHNQKYEKIIKYYNKKFKIKWPIPIKEVSKKDS